jgi:hypothetical protein
MTAGHIRGVLIDPDCREGKHPNCDGTGWDTIANAPSSCPCACHGVAAA